MYFAQEVWGGWGSNQVPRYLGHLLHLSTLSKSTFRLTEISLKLIFQLAPTLSVDI